MIAVSLFGVDQTVLPPTGKAEEYVIRLTQSDVDSLREGAPPRESNIARNSQGGTFYRIYMADQPDRQSIETPNTQNINVQLKPSSRTTESAFAIALSEDQLQALEAGAVFGGTLPKRAGTTGVKFEISSLLPRDVAPEGGRGPDRDLGAAVLPNEIRDRRFRDDFERNRPPEREAVSDGYPSRTIDPTYMTRRADQAKLQLDTPPPSRMYSDFKRGVEEARRRQQTDDARMIDASSPLLNSGITPLQNKKRAFTSEPGFKANNGAGASIDRDGAREPRSSDQEYASPSERPFDSERKVPQSDNRLLLAVLLGLLSLGANFFLGWQVFGWYMRYRDVIDQVRMGSSWSNETRTSTI